MYFDFSFRTPPTKCRSCQSILDAHTDNEGNIPKEGDLSICGRCGTISKFTDGLDLTPLEDNELKNIKENEKDCYKELILLSQIIKEKIKLN